MTRYEVDPSDYLFTDLGWLLTLAFVLFKLCFQLNLSLFIVRRGHLEGNPAFFATSLDIFAVNMR